MIFFGPEFRVSTFGGVYIYKKLAWKCVDMDKACRTYFSGTGKIFVMNCYEFQILFIRYIHLLKKSSYFCVQVKVSSLKHKIITCISTTFAIMLINFWMSSKSLGNSCLGVKQLSLVVQAKRLLNGVWWMFLLYSINFIKYIIKYLL